MHGDKVHTHEEGWEICKNTWNKIADHRETKLNKNCLFVLKHYLSISLEKHLQKAVWSIFNDKQTDIDKKNYF